MAVSWPATVNKKAYTLDIGAGNNVESVEFESGKARTYLKNTAPKKLFSFMVRMEDVGSSSEFNAFITWWDTVLMSGSLSFMFDDLLGGPAPKEYRPTEPFSASGQRYKEVTFTVEEM